MKKIIPLLFLALFLLSSVATFSQQAKKKFVWISPDSLKTYREHFRKNIPEPKGYISDFEEILSFKEEHQLDSIIQHYRQETESSIYVVTLDTTRVAKVKFDELTQLIASEYAIDSKKVNGILMVVSKGHQKIKIKTSSGLEKTWQNKELSDLMNKVIVPYFKERIGRAV